MGFFIEKIKQFFKTIFEKNKLKKLEAPKIDNISKNNLEIKENNVINQNEKNRILNLYENVKNETINLSDINKEDLLKIRKLLLEEAKMQDEKLKSELQNYSL